MPALHTHTPRPSMQSWGIPPTMAGTHLESDDMRDFHPVEEALDLGDPTSCSDRLEEEGHAGWHGPEGLTGEAGSGSSSQAIPL